MSLAFEELRRLVDGPLAAVQPQSGDQPADARERLADLCESITRIVGLETFVADQLLRIMRPAVLAGRGLRERIEANPDAPDLARRPAHEETVHVVARRHLVRRDVGQRR